MTDYEKLNSNQRQLISDWRGMGLSDDEIKEIFSALDDKDDVKGKPINIEEASRIVEEIKRKKILLSLLAQ